jgi:hypothetical protein
MGPAATPHEKHRRGLIVAAVAAGLTLVKLLPEGERTRATTAAHRGRPPNVVVVLTDDQDTR